VIVPAEVRGADEGYSRLDEPARHQQPLAELCHTVALARLRLLASEVKGGAGLRGSNQVISLRRKRIDGLAGIRFTRPAKLVVDLTQKCSAALEAGIGDVFRVCQVLDAKLRLEGSPGQAVR